MTVLIDGNGDAQFIRRKVSRVKIQRTEDMIDCDTCGSSYASGALVYFDDVLAIDFTPVAACYDGDSFDMDYIYGQILRKLGYELEYIDP